MDAPPPYELPSTPPSRKTTAHDKQCQSFLLIGNTGAGKSYLIEEMTGKLGLVGHEGNSTTQEVTPHGTRGGALVIDTPGLADTESRTLRHLQDITAFAKNTPECVAVLVVKFDSKFTDEFVCCLEALSLALGLDSQQYVLVINKIQQGRRESTVSVEEKIQEIYQKVASCIGLPPARYLRILFDAEFDEAELTGRHYQPLKGVVRFDELMKVIKNDKVKLDFIAAKLRRLTEIDMNDDWTDDMTALKGFLRGAITGGAYDFDCGTNSIAEDWEEGRGIVAVAKAVALPVTAVLSRYCALSAFVFYSIVVVADKTKNEIQKILASVDRADKEFLQQNQERISVIWERMVRVERFYFTKT